MKLVLLLPVLLLCASATRLALAADGQAAVSALARVEAALAIEAAPITFGQYERLLYDAKFQQNLLKDRFFDQNLTRLRLRPTRHVVRSGLWGGRHESGLRLERTAAVH